MSAVKKRSVSINGHRTSYSVEDEFQAELENIASDQKIPLARLIADIDSRSRIEGGLSSAIRVFVLNHLLQFRAEQSELSPAARSIHSS